MAFADWAYGKESLTGIVRNGEHFFFAITQSELGRKHLPFRGARVHHGSRLQRTRV